MDRNSAEFKLTKAKTYLVINLSFFGSIALSVPFEEKPAKEMLFGTMETDGQTIWWSREFVDSLTVQELAFVVVHECMHIAMKHMLRMDSRIASKWNCATDYAINSTIVGWSMDGLKMPPMGLIDSKYNNMMAEKIYNLLPDSPQSQGWGGFMEPKSKDGSRPATDSEKSLIEANIDQIVATATAVAKSRGNMPAGIDELIKHAQQPQVEWQDKLRRFIGGEQPDDYSWRKLNRKMYHMHRAMTPGVIKSGVGHIVVGIDTSGSVSSRELSHFLGELNAITEEMFPESVTIIQCDSAIQRVDEFQQGEIIDVLEVKGRGGTRVAPVFKYIEDHNIEVGSFIYFSDMEIGDVPKEQPRYPVLWVNSSGNGGIDPHWGDIARLKVR